VTAAKRVALVGAGHIAETHARALREVGERADFVAVAELSPAALESFANRHGISGRYGELSTMLEAEAPDLVIVCTPPWLHFEQIRTCLAVGAWVLCEKPAAGSLAELDAIEAAELAAGARCASVFQWRFGEQVAHLKRLVESQAMGRPLVASCLMNWYRDADYYRVPWRGRWATELGGPTVGAGIHFMDLLLWLLGDWSEVAAMTATLDRDIEIEDVSAATVRLASGVLVSVVNSMLSPRQETALRLDFQQATVDLRCLYSYDDDDWVYTALPTAGGSTQAAAWSTTTTSPVSREAMQLTGVLDAMDGQTDELVSMADIRPTFDLISSLYKAASTGQTVRRGSIVPGDPYYQHFAASVPDGGGGADAAGSAHAARTDQLLGPPA
jgi:predicted dehydrogenase